MDKLIAKIIGGAVAVESNINRYLQTQGVIVRVSVGGGRNSYYVSPKIYGIVKEQMSEDSNEFLSQHVKNGRISLLREDDEKKIRKIEARVKKRLKEISIGYGDSFVPIARFPEFKDYFEENRQEFFEFRDELVSRYNHIRTNFANIARVSLKEMNAKEGERELEEILMRLPTLDRFKDSFKMDLIVSAFPTTENLDMFDEDIRKEIMGGMQKDEDNLLLESVVQTMNEGFSTLNSAIRSLKEHGKLHSRVILGLKNGISKMAQTNIAGNEKLEKLRVDIELLLTKESDAASENAEYLFAKLFTYAREIGIEERIDRDGCPFTDSDIEDLLLVYM